jgi:hypothetical protein
VDSPMTKNDYEPAFLDDDGPSEDLPTFISTANAHELFGLREGETVLDAIARNKLVKPVSSDADSTQQPIGQTRLT